MFLRPEVKVGLLTVIALVMLAIMVFYINEIKVGERQHEIIVEFNRVVGIKEGAKVNLNGVDIGKVSRADLGDRSVFLHLEVPEGLVLPAESRFVIGTMGLMGESYVGIERRMEVELTISLKDTDSIIPGTTYMVSDPGSGEVYRAEVLEGNEATVGTATFSFSSDSYPSPGSTVMISRFEQDKEGLSLGTAEVLPFIRRFVAVVQVGEPGLLKQLSHLFDDGANINVHLRSEEGDRSFDMVIDRPPRKRVSRSGFMGIPVVTKEHILLVLKGRIDGHVKGTTTSLEITLPGLPEPVKASFEGELFKGEQFFTANEFITEGGLLLRDAREGLVPEGQALLVEARSTVKNLSTAIDGVKKIEDRLSSTFDPEKVRGAVERTVERIDRIGENMEKSSQNVVEATGGVGDFITSVKGDITAVKQRIETLSGKLEDLVGTVDGTLIENKDSIQATIQDARQFTANLKGVSEDVRDDVNIMVKKFRNSSERVERMLQKLEEEEKLPEKAGEILNNIRESSIEIKEATGRVNEFVHDEKIEDDFKSALKGMGEMSGKVDNFLGRFKQTRFDLDFLLGFDDQAQETFGDCNVKVYPLGGSNYFLAGSSDIGTQDTLNLQYGLVVNRYTTRVGIIKSNIGIGLDVRLMESVTGSVEVHNLVSTEIDTSLTCSVSEQVGLFVKVEDIAHNDSASQRFNFGVINSF